jgi:exopolysaccharide production protein ExoQ
MPRLALLLGCIFVWWLFRRDMRWRQLSSSALWIPGLWLAMASSRQMSFWFAALTGGGGSTSNLDGSPVNVVFNGSLLLITILVLRQRGFDWGQFASANKALTAIYLFFLCSMLWSPFPVATVKRLIQESGCVLTGLIILTERDPTASLRIIFTRVSFVLFPLSVIFIRFFPHIGRVVSPASGTHMLCGVADHKNSLGQLAMVFCLALLWDLMASWNDGASGQTKVERWGRVANLGLGLYLLVISRCGTALVSFVPAVVLLFGANRLAHMKNAKRLFMAGVFSLVSLMIVNQTYNISGQISKAMGRGSGLSGRTEIWAKIMEKETSHMIGAGFRGFWETREGESVWRELGTNPLITAHNGYLETYLNGGVVGLILLGALLWATGLNAVNKLVNGEPIGKLAVLFWPILLIANVTESQFIQTGALWFTALLVTIDTPWHRWCAARDGWPEAEPSQLPSQSADPMVSSHAWRGH